MESHSHKKKDLKHSIITNRVSRKQNLKINHHPKNPPKNIIKSKSLWQKVSEILAAITKKNDKLYLLKSIDKLVDSWEIEGLIASEEKKMIKNIINIGDVKVDDVMTPRTDIVAVKDDATLEEIREIILEKEHSRIPVYHENLDEIIGFIHSKDLLKFLGGKPGNFKISNILRKVLYVPHAMRIIDLLLKMRSSQVHIAIVLDEYGGTDGLVTIENIMEEIVGEIEDEHDLPDNNIYMRITKISDDIIQVGGRTTLEKAEELLNRKIIPDKEEVDFDTVGGLILSILKKVPEIGESFDHPSGLTFKVLDADMRSVKLIEISKESGQKIESDSNSDNI